MPPLPIDRRRFMAGALVALAAPSGAVAQSTGPTIADFTMTPPIAAPGGPAEIRFAYHNAQGGLREAALLARPANGALRTSVFQDLVNRAIAELSAASEGVVLASGRHQTGYSPSQDRTRNYYQLQVIDRAGRRSNVLGIELEVRL